MINKYKGVKHFHEISPSTLMSCLILNNQQIIHNVLNEIFFLKFNRYIVDKNDYDYIIDEYTNYFNYICENGKIIFKHVNTSTYIYSSSTSYNELLYKYSGESIITNMLMCIIHSNIINYKTLCDYFSDYYMEDVNNINNHLSSIIFIQSSEEYDISYSSDGILYLSRETKFMLQAFEDISADKIRQYKLDYISSL